MRLKEYGRATVVAAFFAALVAFAFLSCGEPLGPAPFGWVKRADIPAGWGFDIRAVGPRGLYGLDNRSEPKGRLVIYDGSEFLVDYEVEGRLWDVGFFGDNGFLTYVVGYGTENNEAVLVQFKAGVWTEVLRAPAYKYFMYVYPTGPDTCWLIGIMQSGASRVLRFDNGQILDYGAGIPVEYGAYSPQTNTFCAVPPVSEPTAEVVLWVTSDDGSSWQREAVELDGGYEVQSITDVTASPEALYLTLTIKAGDVKYFGILKRGGPAGAGVYEFSYLSWTSPDTFDIEEAAFSDNSHGVAVGLGGSIYYDAPDWVRETTIPWIRFDWGNLVGDPRGGFWSKWGYGLLWHP